MFIYFIEWQNVYIVVLVRQVQKTLIKKLWFYGVAFYGREDGQNTGGEYHALRTFQNNLLWRLFGLKGEDITRKQRKLCDKEFQYN
jgi:hypothetical protein